MNTNCPKYAKKFKCVANLCEDTCCAAWEIVIDEKFQKLYRESTIPAAKKAVSAMYTDSDGDVCLKLQNGRCPMLNNDNLCELYIQMGKDSLCDVCRIYPRFFKESEGMNFEGISLSCPEAARLILSDKTHGELNNSFPLPPDSSSDAVLKTYELMRRLCIKKCFYDCSQLAEDIQDELDFGDFEKTDEILSAFKESRVKKIPSANDIYKLAECISKFEMLTDKWRNLCDKLIKHLEKAMTDTKYMKKRDAAFKKAYETDEIANIYIYYMYKYLPEAIDYADIFSNVRFADVSGSIICELYTIEIIENEKITKEKMTRLAQLFSKEIEHNEDNIEKLI